MTFVISGLDPLKFAPLFDLDNDALLQRGVIAKLADMKPGYPCRISLEDAELGERVLLLNHESHSTTTPFRSTFAIYVRPSATKSAVYENDLPPVFLNRPIALRIFDKAGMLIGADMGINGELQSKIKTAFDKPGAAYIHAHNAMHGCFAAAITRA